MRGTVFPPPLLRLPDALFLGQSEALVDCWRGSSMRIVCNRLLVLIRFLSVAASGMQGSEKGARSSVCSEWAVPHARRGGDGGDERGDGSYDGLHQAVLQPLRDLDLHLSVLLNLVKGSAPLTR